MEHFISSELSTKRLDPWYYRPKFYTALKKIKIQNSNSLLWELLDKERGIKGGATPLGAEYQDSGKIRFYRTSNVKDMLIDETDIVYLSQDQDNDLSRSRLKSEDIILTITGVYFGQLAVISNRHLPGNISQHSVRFRLIGADSHYIVSYFSSTIGQDIIWREAYGATRPAIDYPSIKDLVVYTPSISAQKYIGDKLRQAERLRVRARELESQFGARIQFNYPSIFDTPVKGKYYRAGVSELNRNLNPGAFNPEKVRLKKYIKSQGGRTIGNIAIIKYPTTDIYTPDTLFFGLDAFDSTSSRISPTAVSEAGVTGTCRRMQEGPVISKLRPYLNKVGYIPREFAGSVGSTELLNIIPNFGISGWYIYGVLKLESTIRQLNPISTGSTHPRVSKDDINEVYVPWFDEAETAGQLLESSQIVYFSSEKLTIAAKLLVEALIEGQITESDLIAAQKALEAGDRDPDRAILSRLTRKGMDVSGESPLFSDLDGLYNGLDEIDTPQEVS